MRFVPVHSVLPSGVFVVLYFSRARIPLISLNQKIPIADNLGRLHVFSLPGLNCIFVGHAPLSPTAVWLSVSSAHSFWAHARRDAGQSLPPRFSVRRSLTRHSRQILLHPHIFQFFPLSLCVRGQHTTKLPAAANTQTAVCSISRDRQVGLKVTHWMGTTFMGSHVKSQTSAAAVTKLLQLKSQRNCRDCRNRIWRENILYVDPSANATKYKRVRDSREKPRFYGVLTRRNVIPPAITS